MFHSISHSASGKNFHWIGLLVVLSLSTAFGHAQVSQPKIIHYYATAEVKPQIFNYDANGLSKLDSIYQYQLRLGYFQSHIDTTTQDSILKATLHAGKAILPALITWTIDSIRHPYYTKPQALTSRDLKSWSNLTDHMASTLTEGENNGYPFVSIHPKALTQLNDSTFHIQLLLEPGPLIKYDSLFVTSTQVLPVKYIRRYLGIKQGELYNESALRQLDQRIMEIPFLERIRPNEVRFWQDKADVKVYVKRKRANYFNAILGIRPNDQTGKVMITGDAEIRLLNAFNKGEEIELTWRKLQSQTQDLQLQLDVPYWFGGPVGTETSLKIYKRDSTFTDVKGRYGLLFQLERLNRISVFVEQQKITNLNTANNLTGAFRSSKLNLYGVRLRLANLDYRFNPRRGYELDMEAGTGRRVLSFASTESPEQALNVLKYRLSIAGYIPTWKKQTLRLSVLSQGISSDLLSDAELIRFGGLRTMRGIDEETINTTTFGLLGLEYRWLFEQNGALYAFIDQGWYERAQATGYATDTPTSFGVGVNFETKGGIFTFNYALGQQFDNPLLVRNAKISFGFRNFF